MFTDLLLLLNELTLVVPDASEVRLLEYMLNFTTNESPGNVKLKLFTSNTTPAEADVLADYTEASGNGYSDKSLTGNSWTIATSVGTTTAEYAEQSFVFTGGPVTVYGYMITNTAGTKLLWAERFTDGPYNIPSGGGTIKITAKVQLA